MYIIYITPSNQNHRFLKRAQEQFNCSKAIFDSLVKAFDECLEWYGYDIPAHKTEPRQQFLDSVLRVGGAVDSAYVVFERDTTRKNHSKKSTLEYKFDYDEN